MEALLEREADVENWNDDRLDELSQRVDQGFKETARGDHVARRMDEADARSRRFETRVETEFGRINDRLDKLSYIQLFFLVSLVAALMTDQA